MVDYAAYRSGFFRDFVMSSTSKQDFIRSGKELRIFLKQTQFYMTAAQQVFGEADADSSDPYDAWWPERKILKELNSLKALIRDKISSCENTAKVAQPMLPNSAKPERDLWMARLMLVWCDVCGLPSKNSKDLRGFIANALRPYKTGISDRGAEYFIERWNSGRVERPRPLFEKYHKFKSPK